jgi:hypothetical protein
MASVVLMRIEMMLIMPQGQARGSMVRSRRSKPIAAALRALRPPAPAIP